MYIFPQAFAPFPTIHAPVRKKRTGARASHNHAVDYAPFNLDVERLVAVMMSADDAKKDLQYEQQCRREVMQKLPTESIDWDSVNWVRVWPFETRRHRPATD